MDKLDKIFYINLDRRPDRDTHMKSEFVRIKAPLDKVQRFQAIDGNGLSSFGVGENDLALFKKSDFRRHRNKNFLIGNQLSHMRILQEIVNKKYEKTLILQDDINFIDTFDDELRNVIENIPEDSEVIWIGFHKVANKKKIIGWDLKNQTKDTNTYYHKKLNEYIAQCKTSTNPCSTAYIISYNGAKNFLEHVKKIGCHRATDGNFNDYLRKKNIDYCSRLVLCTGISEFGSDIF
tara:strand:+ start:2327 stop:3031 length:705 start_codon:yes stop_codon:yes gene_type:complete